VRGAMQVQKTALTRYRQVGSDRRAISTSGESHRLSSGQYTFRFGDLLFAEAALHRLSFGPGESHRLSSEQYTFQFGDLLIAEAALHRLSFGPLARLDWVW
jgi:hypothetical protein